MTLVEPKRRHPAPPVRIIHLGLGAFHRAHQAWYTARADDAADWGIAAFTGRSPVNAELLDAQDGVYTLVTRSADRDEFETLESIVQARAGDDIAAMLGLFSSSHVAVVTLTVTEAGYLVDPEGRLRMDSPAIAADIESLRSGNHPAVRSAVGRLLLGLRARFEAGLSRLAVVSCDNLADNGGVLRDACRDMASAVFTDVPDWVDEIASFVSTSVDRITPRTTSADVELVAASTGLHDRTPVVTEPFTDWVLQGEFPSGRPAWETAGARFVPDIEPWELRKLWLLNGAHTLLAALGPAKGLDTVDQAIAEPQCRSAVLAWWDEASRHLPAHLELGTYTQALLDRFENPRIAHQLSQIAADSRSKARIRFVPVALLELNAGRSAEGALCGVAAVLHADNVPPAPEDVQRALLDLSPELAASPQAIETIAVLISDLPAAFKETVR